MDRDLEDTAASPSKKGGMVMVEADGATKRRLAFEEGRGRVKGRKTCWLWLLFHKER
jgi:hypothetical protein